MSLVFPSHRYLGPGNKLHNGNPVDSDDKIAQLHDIAYNKAKTREDIFESDKEAINNILNNYYEEKNWHSLLGAAGLSVKHNIEKTIQKTLYPWNMPPVKNRGENKRKNTDKTSDNQNKKLASHSGVEEIQEEQNVMEDVDMGSNSDTPNNGDNSAMLGDQPMPTAAGSREKMDNNPHMDKQLFSFVVSLKRLIGLI